jgi:hypothetical protein
VIFSKDVSKFAESKKIYYPPETATKETTNI